MKAYLGILVPVLLQGFAFVTGAEIQHPINRISPLRSAHGDNWTAQEQDDRVCRAETRHFSGRVNVTEEKSLFFWFVEARENPNERPIILWLNGGPGASSMVGLFGEVGPCSLDKDDKSTTPNEDSWANDANLIFLDQPAGVGLSTVTDLSFSPTTLEAASADFAKFLSVFFEQIFPQYANNPLYISGESFGGKYVPKFVSDIKHNQAVNALGALAINLRGIILVDAVVSSKYITTGQYDMFCGEDNGILHFNESSCKAMAAAIPHCEHLHSICELTYDAQSCASAEEYCSAQVGIYFYEEVQAHRRSPYDLRESCPEPPVCGGGDAPGGSVTVYLNNPEVQTLLGFDHHVNYTGINFPLNSRWSQEPEIFQPTTKELMYLLDLENFNVLVLNGNYDVIVNTPGTLRQYNEIAWHGQAAFRLQPLENWYWLDKQGVSHKGGQEKSVDGLHVVTIDNAGHMAPAHQQPAVASIVKKWLSNRSE
ncbi:hypothetical protein BP6252_05562 [Coleophoma cylindrospora]|uniref:carboxypeptidase C n=1 Tax=Coleophoma cylindrospora TaxID=1849047 RepID=A0A3D8RTY1_9HELO|nr:hypothetical protein BP6252_05562 [Coleophoma cylindrospora]